ncbi:hypothetical protein C8A05DRAFT_16922 [Staphylotrichum tortipilum]|uniref:Uncharacterized protein n=1 Tax=Staphylotrichum tortipilum TaxID=2831512 RepID=A0AAN6MHJ3_9PEZI|nr:hypothetical protein C8A05DRAFT_16922 [Staphylotrichum longicolle]
MAAVYGNVQTQEELVALFHRNFTLDPISQPAPAPEAAPAPAPTHQPQEEPKIVYISQHYNHSAHVLKQDPQPPVRPASEPPQSEHAAVERILREHGVDPSGLSSAQLQLFKRVDTPEKLRLIELWTVCPPTSSTDNPTLGWSMTTVDQEEALARLRYEQQQQLLIDQQLQAEFMMMQDEPVPEVAEPEPETVMSLDGTPLTPIQAGDGRWISAASASYHYMEPYMASGYEEMARREYEESARRAYAEAVALPAKETATTINSNSPAVAARAAAGAGIPTFNPLHADPVYKTTGFGVADWAREAAMADQYGRIMAMREDEEML